MTRVVVVIACVVALAAGAFAVVQTRRATDEADRAAAAEARAASAEAAVDEDAAVRSGAEAFTTALLTYEAGALDEASRRLADVATEDFLATYAQALTAGVGAAIDDVGAAASVTVREVFTGPVSADTATAFVVADMEVRSQSGTRMVTGLVLRLELVRGVPGWRVDALTTITAEDVDVDGG